MTDLAEIFAYDLATSVHLAGSMVMLTLFAAVTIWLGSTPSATRSAEFTPAFGL